MGAAFDGSIWTRYVKHKKGGVVSEWRELTNYTAKNSTRKSNTPQAKASPRTSVNLKQQIKLPFAFAPAVSRHGQYLAGRFTLECYLGRTLESFEVCRHGIAGPDDHSYLNVSPGDAVNNMIDDLENGKSETSLTYLIQAQQRIARLISQRQFH